MVLSRDDIPAHVQTLCDAFQEGLERTLGDRFLGFYVYGSTAFPPAAITDVDFHVLVDKECSDEDSTKLRTLHENLEHLPLGDELDGYYITLDQARGTDPPQTQLRPEVTDDSWALHRAHVHAGRFVLFHGPDPREILPPATWAELDAALEGELEWLTDHLDEHPAYCVLNLCRILYSYETHDVVVSKLQAATWAFAFLPVEHHDLIRAALRTYAGDASDELTETLRRTRAFHAELCERIARARSLVASS